MKLSWSHDGTIVSGAGGNGSVVFCYIVNRQISWAHIVAVLDEDNKISINDCLVCVSDLLDLSLGILHSVGCPCALVPHNNCMPEAEEALGVSGDSAWTHRVTERLGTSNGMRILHS